MSTPIWRQLGLQGPVLFSGACRRGQRWSNKGTGRTTQTICRALELYAGGTHVIIVTPNGRERERVSKIVWEYFPRVAVTTCLGGGTILVWTDERVGAPGNLDGLCPTTILLWDHSCWNGHGEMSVGAARTDLAANRRYDDD